MVVYYLTGTKCAVRHVMSVHYLRKVWRGPILVLCEGTMPLWLGYFWRRNRVAIRTVTGARAQCVFTRKPEVLATLPAGEYLYLDSDTIPIAPIDGIFEYLKTAPFAVAEYSKWRCGRLTRMRCYRMWRRTLRREVDPTLRMVNLGVIVFQMPGAGAMFKAWIEICRKLDAAGLENTDENAIYAVMSLPSVQQQWLVIPHRWNQSARVTHKFEVLPQHRSADEQPVILHFHGDRHFVEERPFPCQSSYWLRALDDMQQAQHPFIAKQLTYSWGDAAYQKHLDCSGLVIERRTDLCSLIDIKLYQNGVEVGVSDGWFSEYLLANSVLAKLYSVDNWQGKIPGRMGSVEHKAIAVERLKRFGERSLILDDASLAIVETFDDGSLDFIYIDAGHRYFECLMDLEAWWPKLRTGGCLAGHDWAAKRGWGVIPAVQEFTKQVGRPYYLTTRDEPKTHESFYFFK